YHLECREQRRRRLGRVGIGRIGEGEKAPFRLGRGYEVARSKEEGGRLLPVPELRPGSGLRLAAPWTTPHFPSRCQGEGGGARAKVVSRGLSGGLSLAERSIAGWHRPFLSRCRSQDRGDRMAGRPEPVMSPL